jgi:molecular chaperone Hsp33
MGATVDDQEQGNTKIEARSYFVRHRNALMVRAEFSQLYVDYYLHLMELGERPEPADDAMLKDGLAALVLHLISKPWHQTVAWTLHFENPLLNLFVTGESLGEYVVGRVFSDNVKKKGRELFYSQVTSRRDPVRQSTVEIVGRDVFGAVEQYYQQSEQLRARLFRHSDEDIVMVSAQPECDLEWLEQLDEDQMRTLDRTEELSLLEQRLYRFYCGCSAERLFPALAPIAVRDGMDALFEGDSIIKAECPRCGAKFLISRDDLAAFLEQS